MADVLGVAKKGISVLGASQRLSRRQRILGSSTIDTSLQPRGNDMAKMGMKKSGGGKAKMMSPFVPAFGMKSAGGKKSSMPKRSSSKSR